MTIEEMEEKTRCHEVDCRCGLCSTLWKIRNGECVAKQKSDQMVCVCENVWDVNDTDPPKCRSEKSGK